MIKKEKKIIFKDDSQNNDLDTQSNDSIVDENIDSTDMLKDDSTEMKNDNAISSNITTGRSGQFENSNHPTVDCESSVDGEDVSDFDDMLSSAVLDLSSMVTDFDDETWTSSSNQESPMESPITSSIHLQGIKTTQSRCLVCHSLTGRKAVPWMAVQQAWFQALCYIPKSNRTCEEHLTPANKFNEESIQKIKALKQDVCVTTNELQTWLYGISDVPSSTLYNFEHVGVEPEKYKTFFGITKENFDDLVQYLHGTLYFLPLNSHRQVVAHFQE